MRGMTFRRSCGSVQRYVPPPAELDEFVNEESAVYVGLRDFLKSMSADRKRVLRRHGHLSLRLSYETP